MWAVAAVNGQPCLVEAPRPVAGEGEVIIEVRAAGVNRADVLQVAGKYPPPQGAPEILGLEAAGIIVEVGSGVDPRWLGKSVVALVEGGAQAQYCMARAQLCVPLPVCGRVDGFIAGAALMEAAATAWHNLVDLEPRIQKSLSDNQNRRGRKSDLSVHYPPDFTVFIQGGSGGIGTFSVQLAKALGACVAASAGEASRRDRLRLLGAAATADYRSRDELLEMKRKVSGGRGFDVVLDVSGAGGLANNLDLLAAGGRLDIIGLQKGRRAQVDLAELLAKSVCVQGSTIRTLKPKHKSSLVSSIGLHVWHLVETGLIRPVIAQTYPFAQVKQAHLDLGKKTGRPFGKLVLQV